MPGLDKKHSPDYFQIWQADGTVLKRSASLQEGRLPLPPTGPKAPKCWNVTLPDGEIVIVLDGPAASPVPGP